MQVIAMLGGRAYELLTGVHGAATIHSNASQKSTGHLSAWIDIGEKLRDHRAPRFSDPGAALKGSRFGKQKNADGFPFSPICLNNTEQYGASSMQTKRLNDGTFLVAVDGDNIDASHWHVASDGTVLSIKEGGSYKYNRGHVRRKIDEAIRDAGIGISHGWRP